MIRAQVLFQEDLAGEPELAEVTGHSVGLHLVFAQRRRPGELHPTEVTAESVSSRTDLPDNAE